MPSKNKTAYTDVSVSDFINSYVAKDQQKQDSLQLMDLMRKWSGFEPKMWGPTIIGFGNYHYKYASGHEGDAPIIGFSPRKTEFSLYVVSPEFDYGNLLQELGKFSMGKACIYFKKLEDLNLNILEKICRESLRFTQEKYG
jgi:hypothetical protein